MAGPVEMDLEKGPSGRTGARSRMAGGRRPDVLCRLPCPESNADGLVLATSPLFAGQPRAIRLPELVRSQPLPFVWLWLVERPTPQNPGHKPRFCGSCSTAACRGLFRVLGKSDVAQPRRPSTLCILFITH